MAAITPANVIAISDKLTAFFVTGLTGLGTVGDVSLAYSKVLSLESQVLGLGDAGQVLALLQPVENLKAAADGVIILASQTSDMVNRLSGLCGQAGLTGVTDLPTYCTYYNTGAGGPFLCLLAPDFARMYLQQKGTALPNTVAYFSILQGATYTNAMAKFVVSGAVFTAGTPIDQTKYVGGVGRVNVSGLTGSGVVSVTGTWRNVDGTVTSGAVGTVTVSANGTANLTPPSANQLLLSASSVSVAAGITAGTIYVETAPPATRVNPPV